MKLDIYFIIVISVYLYLVSCNVNSKLTCVDLIEKYIGLNCVIIGVSLKVTVELDRGKPRDLRDIEKLYMQGTDRIYSSMSDKVFDMYKNSELYKASRTNKTKYNPVSNTATVDLSAKTPTVTVKDLDSIRGSLKKYFGTDDAYSIYVPAAEQEYGAGKKKPSTAQNKNLKGG